MAICEVCGHDKATSSSCLKVPVQLNGKDFDTIPWGKGAGETSDRCPGCGVKQEGYHHPGCDYESCPRCHGRIVGCNCEQT